MTTEEYLKERTEIAKHQEEINAYYNDRFDYYKYAIHSGGWIVIFTPTTRAQILELLTEMPPTVDTFCVGNDHLSDAGYVASAFKISSHSKRDGIRVTVAWVHVKLTVQVEVPVEFLKPYVTHGSRSPTECEYGSYPGVDSKVIARNYRIPMVTPHGDHKCYYGGYCVWTNPRQIEVIVNDLTSQNVDLEVIDASKEEL